MPAKNVVKCYRPHSYYHVYNRGVAKQPIFLEQADKRYFLSLLDRHFNPDSSLLDKKGVLYKKFHTALELLCFCLMGNHFHLLFYLSDDITALSDCMRRITTAYTMYFNLKYKRVGPLLQGTFKAVVVQNDVHLLHISRYIHLNPREYQTYKYSSLPVYLGAQAQPWLAPTRMLELFEDIDYREFVDSYLDRKLELEIIKESIANG